MNDNANGGLCEAAALPVFDNVPPHEAIARMFDVDGEADASGFVAYAPHPAETADQSDISSRYGFDDEGDDLDPLVGDDDDREPLARGFDVEKLNGDYAVVNWGGKVVVAKEQPYGPLQDRIRVMTVESMNTWFANTCTEIRGSDGKIKPVTYAKAWLTHRQRRQYDGVEFFPDPAGQGGTANYLNFWRGFEVAPSRDGSCDLFYDHVRANICNGDESLFRYVIGWVAHMMQKPRDRLGVALVLRGQRGTGKSKFGEIVGSLFAPHYFQVDDARYVTGRFNDHMLACLLLQADEAVWAGDKEAEGRLKGLITSEAQMVEAKQLPAIRIPNYMRVLMTSNEGWVVPAGMDERRFCVLDVAAHSAQNRTYFAELDAQMKGGGYERLLYDLLHFDLSSVDLSRIPQTKALLEQKLRSLDQIDEFWFNRLYEGGDWPCQVVCADLYAEYIKAAAQIGVSRKRSAAEFGKRLAKLAPLRKCRPSREVAPGVVRQVWCYEMPTLDVCREAFDALVGQTVEWPAPPAGESEREDYDLSDATVPI